jgi:hypothetical protein
LPDAKQAILQIACLKDIHQRINSSDDEVDDAIDERLKEVHDGILPLSLKNVKRRV